MNVVDAIRISRPKFWLYLAGTFAVGAVAGVKEASGLLSPWFVGLLLYFSLPANFFLYGVNDYFDRDTDEYNERKGDEEYLVGEQTRSLQSWLLITAALSMIVIAALPVRAAMVLTMFVILSYAYSGPPTRFKRHPWIDSASNVLYILPGLVGYLASSHTWPASLIVLGGALWTMAMHLYSAVPDIEADSAAGLSTTAVTLGQETSLLLCTVLWTGSTAAFALHDPILLLTALYPGLSLLALWHGRVAAQYAWYPWINGIMGTAGFWYAAYPLI